MKDQIWTYHLLLHCFNLILLSVSLKPSLISNLKVLILVTYPPKWRIGGRVEAKKQVLPLSECMQIFWLFRSSYELNTYEFYLDFKDFWFLLNFIFDDGQMFCCVWHFLHVRRKYFKIEMNPDHSETWSYRRLVGDFFANVDKNAPSKFIKTTINLSKVLFVLHHMLFSLSVILLLPLEKSNFQGERSPKKLQEALFDFQANKEFVKV